VSCFSTTAAKLCRAACENGSNCKSLHALQCYEARETERELSVNTERSQIRNYEDANWKTKD